jgi:hypothetical protein
VGTEASGRGKAERDRCTCAGRVLSVQVSQGLGFRWVSGLLVLGPSMEEREGPERSKREVGAGQEGADLMGGAWAPRPGHAQEEKERKEGEGGSVPPS